MPRLTIRNHRTGETIYHGTFTTAAACVEQAIRDGVSLDYADLRHINLNRAALDDAVMRHALLDGANLAGANLSEAALDGTSFRNAAMQDTCLCLSSLNGCRFEGALFGGTDIAGASLRFCTFATLSALLLGFAEAAILDRCRYIATNGEECAFSSPPLVLHGMDLPVAFFEKQLKIGTAVRPFTEWFGPTNDNRPLPGGHSPASHIFFERHRPLLQDISSHLEKDRSERQQAPRSCGKA